MPDSRRVRDGRVVAPVVDAQVHTWAADCAEFPWSRPNFDQLPVSLRPLYLASPRTTEALVAMMDEIGVDAALLTSPWLYGNDLSYVLSGADRYPSRFGVVAPFDASDGDVAPVLDQLRRASVVGVRILLASPKDAGRAGYAGTVVEDVISSMTDLGRPVFVSPMGRFDEVRRLARQFPETTFVLDHLGLWMNAPVEERLTHVGDLLALAIHSNVLLKCSAVPELSSQPYPFEDLWPMLHRVIEGYGIERLMWGSDINQHLDQLSYRQSLDYLRESNELGSAEKESLLGGAAIRHIPGLESVLATGNIGGGSAGT